MKHILVVGIGTGNPEHLTVQAINALNRADVLFVPTKGAKKADLAGIRRDIIRRYVTNPASRTVEFALPVRRVEGQSYVSGVDEWHRAISEAYIGLLEREVAEGGTCALLVWGDPMLYDSTLRIIERVRASGRVDLDVTVIPGITSIQALCASHRIPLNLVGKPVEITTGRRLQESFPGRCETAVVMLDGEQAFTKVSDPDAKIYWGAYLGTPDEVVISGPVVDCAGEISRVRAEERARHGWIMDIYLLQKGADFDDE
nr:precorrin-6A synthase (deacetylating) [uncultured Gellertiella sp.]